MRVLTTAGWISHLPRYHLGPASVRIAVQRWVRLTPVTGLYFQGYGAAKVWNSLQAFGVRETLRKVRSRRRESLRNLKYVALGQGVITEAAAGTGFPVGASVKFVAPAHPACVDELCLPAALVAEGPGGGDPDRVLTWQRDVLPERAQAMAGWSPESGLPLPVADVATLLESAGAVLEQVPADVLSLPRGEGPSSRALPPTPSGKVEAVLFGYGQYAKVMILGRLPAAVSLRCCHEIDPTQVGDVRRYPWEVRTSPLPEPDERYGLWFAAGYHHTHALIAAQALAQGAAVVVEKPLATTHADLDRVLAAMPGGRLFTAYQRRYSPFNGFLRRDLAAPQGAPISMRAVVYEVPLPPRHWYRWPASRGRIVCNGCHWIDYFLFLNGWSRPTALRAERRANGDVVAQADLENGASLSLIVTEHGSARLGVRDIVHLTHGDRTVVITDQRHYQAESSSRRLRRARTSLSRLYGDMYTQIVADVLAGGGGDSPQSARVSARAVLDLQDQVEG
jgi:hypothetical protein